MLALIIMMILAELERLEWWIAYNLIAYGWITHSRITYGRIAYSCIRGESESLTVDWLPVESLTGMSQSLTVESLTVESLTVGSLTVIRWSVICDRVLLGHRIFDYLLVINFVYFFHLLHHITPGTTMLMLWSGWQNIATSMLKLPTMFFSGLQSK